MDLAYGCTGPLAYYHARVLSSALKSIGWYCTTHRQYPIWLTAYLGVVYRFILAFRAASFAACNEGQAVRQVHITHKGRINGST
jgi:hypothetical protein